MLIKIREDENISDYAKRVSEASNRELKRTELKQLVSKKLYSDDGDMTRFNKFNNLSKYFGLRLMVKIS